MWLLYWLQFIFFTVFEILSSDKWPFIIPFSKFSNAVPFSVRDLNPERAFPSEFTNTLLKCNVGLEIGKYNRYMDYGSMLSYEYLLHVVYEIRN